jgi:hypothetical protein
MRCRGLILEPAADHRLQECEREGKNDNRGKADHHFFGIAIKTWFAPP